MVQIELRHFSALPLVLVLFANGFPQDSDKIGGFGWGMSLSFGGFHLEGNKGGNELKTTGRSGNETDESESIGLGFLGAYRLNTHIELNAEANLEWAAESLDDSYLLRHLEAGGKFLWPFGILGPFLNAGYSHVTVSEFQVYDPKQTESLSKVVEYDYSGHGIHYGLGLDVDFGTMLTYSMGYRRNMLFGFSTDDGFVEFDNTPSIDRWFFNFKIWL